VRDYRVWWGLFVLFAVLSLLVVQRGIRGWRAARDLIERLELPPDAEPRRRLRREAWRLGWMMSSLVGLTGLVFAAVLGAPPAIIFGLKVVAVVAVAAVVALSLVR
jgi:hypothetical protein